MSSSFTGGAGGCGGAVWWKRGWRTMRGCKFLHHKCVRNCIFTLYFNQDQEEAQLATVYKRFGASNVSKLLIHIPTEKHAGAVTVICHEANARLRDPIYSCVFHIFVLQQQVGHPM
jgi:hypothetical protein